MRRRPPVLPLRLIAAELEVSETRVRVILATALAKFSEGLKKRGINASIFDARVYLYESDWRYFHVGRSYHHSNFLRSLDQSGPEGQG